jgi:acyl-CoA reductase-like NAD-dependent aldehyde dehydrogenase
MASLPAFDRAKILQKTSAAIEIRRESLSRLIAEEAGKPIKTARAEVDRATLTFQVAAEEANRIHGETIPFDASPNGSSFFGYWWRRPVGIVAAITPFNFPLNLVAHKVAPALAAGNSFVLKPAEQTPLTAIALFEILLESGMPPEAGQLLQGEGETVGDAIVADPRVAKVSFTGSAAVGKQILS